MTLAEFAKDAGVEIVLVDPKDWGAKFAYTTADHPNCKVCGFSTEQSAYKHWLSSTFGKRTAKAIQKLMREAA